ncbi:MAG: polysaccharide deacetylase family protein [Clostridiaceae bacterium]|nr:polysaccharide deacetylase family protein [Clostridiaceae bacterium]
MNKANQKRNIPKIVAFVLSGLLIITLFCLAILISRKTRNSSQFISQDIPDSFIEEHSKQAQQQNQINVKNKHNPSNSQRLNRNPDDNILYSTRDLSCIISEINEQTENIENTISEFSRSQLTDSDPANTKDSDSVSNTLDTETNLPDETTEPSTTEIPMHNLVDYHYIALTFDDGPYDVVDLGILALLDKFDGHATFFLVGSRIDAFPDTVKAMAEQGSELANHSFSHSNFTTLSHEALLAEINLTNQIIQEYTGITPALIRPPGGSYNNFVLEALPYPLIMWNYDTLDWRLQDVDSISKSLENVKPGAVVLMHSLYPETLKALEKSLPVLYEQGYRFVTVSDLYRIYGVPLTPHICHNAPPDELGY